MFKPSNTIHDRELPADREIMKIQEFWIIARTSRHTTIPRRLEFYLEKYMNLHYNARRR